MLFEALYVGHFLSFYTMQLEPPKKQVISQRMRNCFALRSNDRRTFFPSGVPTSATSTSTSLPLGLLQLPGTRDPPYT